MEIMKNIKRRERIMAKLTGMRSEKEPKGLRGSIMTRNLSIEPKEISQGLNGPKSGLLSQEMKT